MRSLLNMFKFNPLYLKPFKRCFTTANSPPSSIRIIRTATNDPYFNLAYEECLLNEHIRSVNHAKTDLSSDYLSDGLSSRPCTPTTHTLFLWCNSPSVILGRYQNPYAELHLSAVESQGVEIVRRKTGGGTVYQDQGNSIFSFISPDSAPGIEKSKVKAANNEILINSLKSLGISAENSGRNDIVADFGGSARKVSGQAFRRESGVLLQHGTMLIHVDFSALQSFLNPNKLKLLSKGVSSVSARVVNLRELAPQLGNLTHNEYSIALATEFAKFHGILFSPADIELVDHEILQRSPRLQAIYTQLRSFPWRYGQTPHFSHILEHKFPWGLITLHVNVQKGLISEVKLFSDALYTELIEILEREMGGNEQKKVQFTSEGLTAALDKAKLSVEAKLGLEVANYVEEFKLWLLQQL
jgi:lipoate-protein ligase A